ncbi:hypothetical protein BHF71_09970 [Vulcanibacillus modesticaldus]|uniref:DUF3800 domain-containing protein n=1 Tax=Vulcanibacillus modesticaldus TaxID=337097 RepID=A0A1D2YU19_9BACI|nr:DUF3800 domain-containing protein [Vulcanibacillus modesticaldus]OEF99151.1 hypothetical protein BHF71_09970 [Vulcanibacillus modesticaldus]
MLEYDVFVDESGNSGLNLFDYNQPYFWVSALIAPKNSNQVIDYEVKKLKDKIRVEELHGNELGLGRINKLAHDIIEVYREIKAKFIFVRVHKSHVSTMKFVDCLIDSAHNPAIPEFYYFFRENRIIIAHSISAYFGLELQKWFWEIYISGNVNEFKKLLLNFKDIYSYNMPDPRLKEIILDALNFAIDHPEEILDDFKNEFESPNLISFSLLLDGLKKSLPKNNSKIDSIIHDEQSQFAKYIKKMFEYLSKMTIKEQYSKFPVIEIDDKFNKSIEFSPSSKNAGLQLIDVTMWLLKQKIDKKKVIHGEASDLIHFISENGIILEFSHESQSEEVKKICQDLMSREFTTKQINQAEAYLSALEKERKNNIKNRM